MARSGRGPSTPRAPQYPTYQAPPPSRSPAIGNYDSYEAEKNKKTFASAPKGKGMQLGKKSKTPNLLGMLDKDRSGDAEEESAPLVSSTPQQQQQSSYQASSDHPITVTINETISAELTREGALRSYEIKGDLQLRISDASMNRIRLNVTAEEANGVQFKTHPNVDRNLFNSSKIIQAKDANRPFPANGQSLGVLRWRQASRPGADDSAIIPITFVVWVNRGSGGNNFSLTVEYELNDPAAVLRDVVVAIPYQGSEPVVNSMDEVYEVTGDSLEWNIKTIDASTGSGSFEFDAGAEDEGEFFPMEVRFKKDTPFVDVDVSCFPQVVAWVNANVSV